MASVGIHYDADLSPLKTDLLYLFCQFFKRRHTSVMCRQIDWQEFDYKPQVKEVMGSIASVRLDAVIGLAFSQSYP